MKILDQFALQVWRIAKEALAEPEFDRDAVQLMLVALLSQPPYSKKFLYQDFGTDPWHKTGHTEIAGKRQAIKIHDQAITYVFYVLPRRVALANKLRDAPTNMHVFFKECCLCGPEEDGWAASDVRREKISAFTDTNGSSPFSRTATVLRQQCDKLSDNFGANSRGRRAKHGPIVLRLGPSVAEMPEEMSLWDVFEALPTPLHTDRLGVSNLERLTQVLKALNDRYMLLRGCGLDPQLWLERSEPSIGNLRQLKELRRHSQRLLEKGEETRTDRAFRRAFEAPKGANSKHAGFDGVEQFLESEVGQQMLRIPLASLDSTVGQGDDGDDSTTWVDVLADDRREPVEDSVDRVRELETGIRALMDKHPKLFTPVLRYACDEWIGRSRPLFGAGESAGVINDPKLLTLIEADPKYATLSDGELAEMLWNDLARLFKRGLKLTQHSRTAEVMQ